MKPETEVKLLDALTIIAMISLLTVSLLSCGCTVTKYVSSTGETFSRTSFGTKLSVSEMTVAGDTNGIRTIAIRGYANDQVQAIGVAVSAAVSAAVTSIKP